MDEPVIRERLRVFLARDIFLDRKPESIGDDDDLVSLGLDSLSVLRLVLFLETEIGVALDGEEVLGDQLSSIRRIAAHCAAARG